MANNPFIDLLGTLLGTGMAPKGNDRLREALGAGGPASGTDLTDLLNSLGIDMGKIGDGLGGGNLGDLLGGAQQIGDLLGGLFGGQGGQGIGQTLSTTLGEAQRALGDNQDLALAALGALAGAILGGGSKSMKGAVGGGVLALLGALAYQALKGTRQETRDVPLSLQEPNTPAAQAQLENQAQLLLRAMINAAKADGQIDQNEVQQILSRLQESGTDKAAFDFVMTEMTKPMETETIVAAARGNPQLAAEIYAASLLAIKVDTPAEHAYMQNLAAAFNLPTTAVANLERSMGFV